MIPKSFDYYAPASLDEAIRLLGENEEAKVLAGGQSLLPMMKLRLAAPTALVDISKLPGPILRAGRRRPPRDWGAHDARRRRARQDDQGEVHGHQRRGGQDRRPAGQEPRHDRRERVPRRPCRGPPHRPARPGRSVCDSGEGWREGRARARLLRGRLRDRRRARRDTHRDTPGLPASQVCLRLREAQPQRGRLRHRDGRGRGDAWAMETCAEA